MINKENMQIKNITSNGINLFLFFILMLLIIPINPYLPFYGLDPSWKFAMNYAFLHDFQFGKDIYFTFGPLSDFWFPTYFYSESTYKIAIFLSFFLSFIIFLSLVFITKNTNLLVKIISFLAIIIGLKVGDTFLWYIIPILFVQIVFLENVNKKLCFVLSIVLVFFLSFSVLIKFSHFPTAILAVLIIDIYFYIKNRTKIPLFTLLFFVFMIILFVISGQNITNFIAYFIGSFNTLSGYSESMQIFSSNKMIYIFLILNVLMLIILFKTIIIMNNIKTYIFLLISALILFMAFKNGFVRHDGHAVAAYSGLSFVFGLLLIYFSQTSIHKFKLYLISILCLISVGTSYMVKIHYMSDNSDRKFGKVLFTDIIEIKKNFLEISNLLNKSRIEQLNSNYKFSVENIKKQIDLTDIKGSVDIYPWDQSFVIAHGLDYKPRPLLQSYSVYTPYLIEKNIEFLKSNRAPDNILFTIKEIDNRAPFMMEGASWLEIMKRYDVVDFKGEFLVLNKSTEQKDYSLEEFESINVKFGDEIEVPNEKQIYVNIDIQKSFFGKIINTLFKTPILWIELTFENGSKEKYRIIPGIASSGFILSPSIKSIGDFFNFSVGNNDLNQNKVKSFKVINDSNFCYKNDIGISFNKINTENFKILDKVSSKLEKMNFYNKIVTLNENLKAPFFKVENYKNEQIIFSHVGIRFKVSGKLLENSFNNSKKVEVKYSIKEEAYTQGANEGACFNVYEENKLIKNNCINPRDVESDRELKSFVLDYIDSNKNYIFEVMNVEGKSSSHGWSYWQF